MPTYLLHGFRWPRPLVRIHIILQNLDDAAAEWLVAPQTTRAILGNLHDLYPNTMEHLPKLRFIEQYDPADLSASQPYAYVADIVEEVRLGVCIDEVTTKGISNEQWSSILELRDKLAPEEKVGWFVVVCGDEERWAPPVAGQQDTRNSSMSRSSEAYSDSSGKPNASPEEREPRGFRRIFGSMSSRKNRKR